MIDCVHRSPDSMGGQTVTPYYYVLALNPRDWFYNHEIVIESVGHLTSREIECSLLESNLRGRVKWHYTHMAQDIHHNGVFVGSLNPDTYTMIIKFTRAADATYFKLINI